MPELLTHLDLLSQTTESIAQAEERRPRQIRHVARLRAAGRQTRQAEVHLNRVEQNLTKWRRSQMAIRWAITLHRDFGPLGP